MPPSTFALLAATFLLSAPPSPSPYPLPGGGEGRVRGTAPRSEGWPEFRGPAGEGLVKEGSLPTEWGPDKNVAWKQDIPGKGWSSPVIVAGRIYLTTAVPTGEAGGKELSLRALCLDAAKGNIVWDKEVFVEGAKA